MLMAEISVFFLIVGDKRNIHEKSLTEKQVARRHSQVDSLVKLCLSFKKSPGRLKIDIYKITT